MNKFFVGLLVVIAGGVFGWYYFKGNNVPTVNRGIVPNPSPVTELSTSSAITPGAMDESPIATLNVIYGDSGFSPAKITVKRGMTVVFANGSNGKMWVASDVHPTHQLLPGFDELKAEAKGATYTYTFIKVGTWTYHNHASPTNTGVVVVTE